MRQRLAFAALAVAVFCAAPVLAQCEKTCAKHKTVASKTQAKTCASKSQDQSKTCASKAQAKTCDHGKKAAKTELASTGGDKSKTAMCSSDVTCDGDRVRYAGVDLPRIGFKVGDKTTCCMKSATEMAGDDAAKIKFVVADQTYDSLGEAQSARLKVLEKYYEDLLTVKYAVGDECVGCPTAAKDLASKSGKPIHYRLASYDFDEKAAADKAVEAARAASEKVTMNCVVGDKSYTCPMEAAHVAKTSGKKVEYCVGKDKTACETTAKTRLIEARITAALETLAEAAQS